MSDFYFAKSPVEERAERSELFDSVVGQLNVFFEQRGGLMLIFCRIWIHRLPIDEKNRYVVIVAAIDFLGGPL